MRRCKRRMMGTDYKRGPDEIDRTPTGTKVESLRNICREEKEQSI